MPALPTSVGSVWVRRWSGPSPPLVALHGFTQHGGMFAELAGLLPGALVAPDLPGHGRTRVTPVTMAAAVTAVAELLAVEGAPLPLLGYSQGGRVALHVALDRPGLVSRLVLVSASPGIRDGAERVARRTADEELAARLENDGLVSFLDGWLAMPLFAGLAQRADEWRRVDRGQREENTASGLAASLRGLGTGTQRYLGDRLGELQMPVLLVAGENDAGYRARAAEMAELIPAAAVAVIGDAGHSVIGEMPRQVAAALADFLPPVG